MTLFILIVWFSFFVILRVGGVGIPWRRDNLSVNERTMKTILDSCYENDSSSSPIVIIGNYNGFHDKSSIIRLSHSFKVDKSSAKNKFNSFPASRVIITAESPDQFKQSFVRFRNTKWWSNTAQFFVIEKYDVKCTDVRAFVLIVEKFEILNSIYICNTSVETSGLITLNWIANYAPDPWEKATKVKNRNFFRQLFNPRISCNNLHYDKTKILNGHKIRLIGVEPNELYSPHIDYFNAEAETKDTNLKIWQTIITKWNATGSLEIARSFGVMVSRLSRKDFDIIMAAVIRDSDPELSYLFPHAEGELIAVVKLNREVSTLDKIRHIWSTPVLYLAAFSLAILCLILRIVNRDFSSATLDLIRLLIYSSILRIGRLHSFRVYLTTMLIFMVISNGVFQGLIAAFLTTRERVEAIATINELVKLDYKMYTTFGMQYTFESSCAKCKFKEVSLTECMEYVLNSTRHLCAISRKVYEQYYNLLPVDYVQEAFTSKTGGSFVHRKGWPLGNTVNGIIMRLVESGIIDFWNNQVTFTKRQKRREMESEWHSAQYRPVKLYKLDFAFHLLALGLSISTIVFFVELLVAKCEVCKKYRFLKCMKKCRK